MLCQEFTNGERAEGVTLYPIKAIFAANVSQAEEVSNMFDRAIECFGKIDILINNAGIQIEGSSRLYHEGRLSGSEVI